MATFEKVLIKGTDKAKTAASKAVEYSIEFTVVPLPFDEYEFYVKPESVNILDEFVS